MEASSGTPPGACSAKYIDMPDYGLYKIANSTEIPRFVGSALPELTAVAAKRQSMYDFAQSTDQDKLDQLIKSASSLDQDKPAMKALIDEYRARMADRAARGDYENMVRETATDARDFVTRYAPIAASQRNYSEWVAGLNKQVTEDKMSKQLADEAIRYGLHQYKGVQLDPTTKQYTGVFQGYTPANEVDFSDVVKKALQDINPRTIGWNVRRDDKGFYREEGDKTVRLGMKELWPHVQSYISTNEGVQSHMRQRAMLDSYQAESLRPEDVQDSALLQQINDIALRDQVSFGQAARKVIEQRSRQGMENTLYDMTRKYIRNDKESWNKLMGETEATTRAAEDKEMNPFMATIMTNLPGSQLDSPTKVQEAIGNAERTSAQEEQRVNDFVTINGIKPGPNGTYVDKDGNNVSRDMWNSMALLRQARLAEADMKARDEKLRVQSGFVITPQRMKELTAKANEIEKGRIERLNQKGIYTTAPEPDKVLQTLIKDEPGYAAYQRALKENAVNQSVPVGIRQFSSEKANKSAAHLVTSLQQDLDNNGLNKGMLGLTDMQGNQLKDEDYANLKAKTVFAGYYKSPVDGSYKLVYKVGDMRYNSKGEPIGEPTLVQMNAGPDVVQYLYEKGEVAHNRDLLATQVAQLEGTSTKQTSFALPNNYGRANVRRIEASEYNRPEYIPGTKYVIEYELSDGSKSKRSAQSPDEVVIMLDNVMGGLIKQEKK